MLPMHARGATTSLRNGCSKSSLEVGELHDLNQKQESKNRLSYKHLFLCGSQADFLCERAKTKSGQIWK